MSNNIQYIQKYQKTYYDRLTIKIPKGAKAALQQIADDRGLSVNKLCIEAIEDKYNISLNDYKKVDP